MKYLLLLAGVLTFLPQMALATVTTPLPNRDVAIFFSNDLHGETEPCG